MSLALFPLKTYKVLDPLVNISEKREFAIIEGGGRVTYKNFTTNSFSTSSIQFSAPPPNPNIIVSRHLKLKVPVRLTFVGTTSGGLLLQSGLDGFRANPISSVMSTATATLNNTSVSINMSDIVHPLSRYNTGIELKDRDYSTTPCKMDMYQRYIDQIGSNKNSLGSYNDGYDNARGGFPMNIISNTTTGAVVEAELSELLYLSPFIFGHQDKAGFQGLQTMDFNFTFGSDLSRMWSHIITNPVTSTITSITVEFLQPSLLFKYVTPSVVKPLPKYSIYPYFDVQRYPTDSSVSLAPNATARVSTQNIQLQSIPHRMYVFARKKNSALTFTDSDTYIPITGISVNWNNRAGLLSNATQQQLYDMSVKNGYTGSWAEWSGGPVPLMAGTNTAVGLCGGPLCMEFGTDIALQPNEAQGLLGTYQLQMDVQLENVNQVDTFAGFTLYVIVVSSGTFTITGNQAIAQIGVISEKDVLNSATSQMIDYNDISDAYGGDFFSGLKRFGENVLRGVKKGVQTVAPMIQKGIEVGAPIAKAVLPHALKLLPLLGLGMKDVTFDKQGNIYRKGGGMIISKGGQIVGGSVVGGKRKKKAGRPKKRGKGKISRSQLRKMLY